MKPGPPREQLAELKGFVRKLEKQFLQKHLSETSLSPPTPAEQLDAAAYAVLAHGALERFVEGLAFWILERTVEAWLKKKTTPSTASILMYGVQPATPSDKEKTTSVFDRIRVALGSEKSTISQLISANNGVSVRHLQVLFYPLGVNVPNDPVLTPSLESIVAIRHQWAHQYHFGATVVTSAADVKKVVNDCVMLAHQLATAVKEARPR